MTTLTAQPPSGAPAGREAVRRPRLLIVSFSPIASDARVLKQVHLFTPTHEVTTCGFGEAPEGVAHHVRIPDNLVAWRLSRGLLVARRFEEAQARQEVVAWARTQLRPGGYDVVLADDVETVPLALWLRPVGGVHADLHEYSPRLKESVPRWRLFVQPYMRWLCRTYVTRADSVTTVSVGLAGAYHGEFGIRAEVVTNATPFRDAEPTPVGRPLRLVHSGAALPDRHLEVMVEAMGLTCRDATLDMYLTRTDPAVIEALRSQADALSPRRVRVLDPVPYEELVETLAGYDVGVFSLAPLSFSYKHALPNKLFDFVQARLAVVVSPNPEMAAVVRGHDLGLVTEDYSAASLARAIDALDEDTVAAAKAACHAAARDLSAQEQVGIWWDAVVALETKAAAVDRSLRVPASPTESEAPQGTGSKEGHA